METIYGTIPTTNGHIWSEDYFKIVQQHFLQKTNWRGNVKMPEKERTELKTRMYSHPDKNHCPKQFGQRITLS